MIAFWDLGGIRLHSGSGRGGVGRMTLVGEGWWVMIVKEEYVEEEGREETITGVALCVAPVTSHQIATLPTKQCSTSVGSVTVLGASHPASTSLSLAGSPLVHRPRGGISTRDL